MNLKIERSLIPLSMLLLVACGNEGGPKDTLTVGTDSIDATQATRAERTKAIFFSIPSPMETAGLLKKAGAEYQVSLLNDVNNVNNYTSASKQALNMGIYGADLSYASVFNHTNESMLYTSCAKKLADKLGVIGAFDDATIDRMQRNLSDRDSLLDIVSETYWNMDAYLKENDRENISALMIAGGWMEGLHIGVQVCTMNDTPELRQRLAEQKLSLEDLIALIATYDTSDAAIAGVKKDLDELLAIYQDVKVGGGENAITQENGITVVGSGGPKATLTDAQFAALREKVTAIRTNYIN